LHFSELLECETWPCFFPHMASSSISTGPATWRSSNNPLCRFRHRMWTWSSTSTPLIRSSDIWTTS